jgi:hypothetical protein
MPSREAYTSCGSVVNFALDVEGMNIQRSLRYEAEEPTMASPAAR